MKYIIEKEQGAYVVYLIVTRHFRAQNDNAYDKIKASPVGYDNIDNAFAAIERLNKGSVA